MFFGGIHMFTRFLTILSILTALVLSSCDRGDDSSQESSITPEIQEKAEVIKGKIKEYVDAVNARDVDTVVEKWSDQAVYKNPFNGELVNGRKGIRSEFEKIFSNHDDAKVSVNVKTIRFPIDEKAVEEGTATISIPGREPMESDYKMIYINEDGNWLILHVSQLGFGLEEDK